MFKICGGIINEYLPIESKKHLIKLLSLGIPARKIKTYYMSSDCCPRSNFGQNCTIYLRWTNRVDKSYLTLFNP